MTVTVRSYQYPNDYEAVGEFLVRLYQNGDEYNHWLQPRWEYMHYHPYLFEGGLDQKLDLCGIWEDDGKIVGVAHFELQLGEAFIELDPEYSYLKEEMVEYAEKHLGMMTDQGQQKLHLHINENDEELAKVARERGFIQYDFHPQYHVIAQYLLDEPIPEVTLPEGYRLISLAEENDLEKVHAVLWRGFNHGPDPDDDIECRRLMQSAPNFDKELNVVVVAPNGEYVAYAGMWFDPINKVGYVEPVATDPEYRKMGLGKAAVLETVRRVAAKGATVAYVETGLEFYQRIGFKKAFHRRLWYKELD